MLSVENPPDSPCSCTVPALKCDEKAHPPERVAFLEADPAAGPSETETTHFSIRGYVLSSRSKNIGTNWPFPKPCLQLCLKYGATNLLPPFETPDLVRAHHIQKFVESQQPILSSEVGGALNEVDLIGSESIDTLDRSGAVKDDHCEPVRESVLGSTDQARSPLSDGKLRHGDAEVEPMVMSHDHSGGIRRLMSGVAHSVQETISVLKESAVGEATKDPPLSEKVESLCELPEKKYRLDVEFSVIPEPNRAEDIEPNSSLVSDFMASKVCPVCRTFSSTSNTTLNAHIDQCLSVEPSSIRNVSRFSKHMVKPRKKRSMVEILATAPCCTLEDLDRRNGTNWALEFSTVKAPISEVSSAIENKRARFSPLETIDDENEGVANLNSNCMQLQILSKSSDMLSAAAVDCPKPKKLRKEPREGMSFSLGKKKCLPLRHKKFLQANGQSKKMSSFEKLKGKAQKALEGKFCVDVCHMEESTSKSSTSHEQLNIVKPRTLGQWVCSKRSGISKHFNGKLKGKTSRSPFAIVHHTSVEGDVSFSGDPYAVRGPIQKPCRSSDEITLPVKTRSVNMLSNTILVSDDQERHSANPPEKHSGTILSIASAPRGLLLKIPGSSGNYVSSERKKRMGIHANIFAQKCDKFVNLALEISDNNCHPLAQNAKIPRKPRMLDKSEDPMGPIKCTKVMKNQVLKNLCKHRSAEKCRKQTKELTSAVVEENHGALDLGSTRIDITSGTLQSNFSISITGPETRYTFDRVSPSPSNMADPEQVSDDSHALHEGECIASNQVQHGVQCHHTGIVQIDAQDEISANLGSMLKSPLGAIGDCVISEVVTSGDHTAATCDRLGLCTSHDSPNEPSAENEAITDASVSRLLDDQGMYCGDIGKDIQMVSEMEPKDDSCSEIQTAEFRTDPASFQPHVTSHRDTLFELLQENSSVAFGITANVRHANMVINAEPPQSPVSASSSVSRPPMEEFKFKDAQTEPLQPTVAISEKLRSNCSYNSAFLTEERESREDGTMLENKTQGVKAISSVPEFGELSDGQPCFCPRRESNTREPQLLRQSVMAGMTLPKKDMAASLSIKPVMSSFGVCSYFRSEAMASPVLESPTDSISMKASLDFQARSPTRNDLGLESPSSCNQMQSPSNPILRLMGKDLMVMNREEQPVQGNQSETCFSIETSDTKCLPLLEFSSACSLSNQDNSIYQPPQFLGDSMLWRQHATNTRVLVPPPTGQMDYFAGTPLDNGLKTKSDSQSCHRTLNGKPNSSPMTWRKYAFCSNDRNTGLVFEQTFWKVR